MALDINGYNETFNAFIDFAAQSIKAGKSKAIARAGDAKTQNLADRAITAAKGDWIGNVGRLSGNRDANNTARTLFREAIAEMFGGESRIPPKVKEAMVMADYGKGKPLTARRIMAIKNAIDTSGTTEDRMLNAFKAPGAEQKVLEKGFTKAELPKLARATNFLVKATGMDEMKAMEEVAKPGSKANRLMQYGGRFLDNAQDFANGLRLIDSFKEWFAELKRTVLPIYEKSNADCDFSTADTPTKRNIDNLLLQDDKMMGLEKFIFEELASNSAHDLSGKDPEQLFGFENNAAMRFIGRGYGKSVLSTIANIPPAKRAVIYAAFDLFTHNATNTQEAYEQNLYGAEHRTTIAADNSPTFLARLIRHFDKLESMHDNGTLTAQNILDKLFPDIEDKGDYDYKAVNEYFTELSITLSHEEEEVNPYADLTPDIINNTMNNCGTTVQETVKALRSGKTPPIPKMLCTASVALEDFDGKTKGGRKLVASDADRPANYSIRGGAKDILKGDNICFGFTFPDGDRHITNSNHTDNIPVICEKVEKLCGKVHVAQANSVMLMLCQSGLTPLRAGIPSIGVSCNEHSAVDYSLSKDGKTGAVTIKYSSPAGLPFHFSWTATVDVDGNVSSTPMVAKKLKAR